MTDDIADEPAAGTESASAAGENAVVTTEAQASIECVPIMVT